MGRARVEYQPESEHSPLSHLLSRLVPPHGLEIPEKNRTVTSLSTQFEVHIIDGIAGASEAISGHFPDLSGVFPDSLVIKRCSVEPDGFFVHSGRYGQETLIRETEVALREKVVPVVLGLGWLEKLADGRSRLFYTPGRHREAVMVMPKYSQSSDFERVVSDWTLTDVERRGIMRGAVVRMLALKKPLSADVALLVGDSYGTGRLVEQTLERALTWGPELSFESRQASELFAQSYRKLKDDGSMRTFMAIEAVEGGVGDQHGDPRPFDNASVIRDIYGLPVTVIRDPVRLYQTGKGGLEPGWTNFHLSHDYMQLGLLLARSFVDEQHQDLFRYGIEAYSDLAPSPRNQLIGDRRREALVGLGIAYGILVEIVVRGYRNDSGPGPVIDDYWRVIGGLSESNFLSWTEVRCE